MAENTNPERKAHYTPIQKNVGVTPAEKYLNGLCHKNFLSMWSYPGVYRDQGKSGSQNQGKEICDLLVVCGEHVIIFSDKHCVFQSDKRIELAWQRWFKKAIWESAEQAWGAERWLRQYPTRVFLDRQCTKPLPIDLPDHAKAKYHLVVVAHGVSEVILNQFDGTGSLLVNSRLRGHTEHVLPFSIGDLAPGKTFVHVFDDSSLHTLMHSRDTISDFVNYLDKRASLLRGPTRIYAPGEEELLAVYLKNMNGDGEHDFAFPTNSGQPYDVIAIEEGQWQDFEENPQRIAQRIQDRISYGWDEIIEKFSRHALNGEQYFSPPNGIKDSEKILGFMARETRFKRRCLCRILKTMLETTSSDRRRLRIVPPIASEGPHYVLLLLPRPSLASKIPEEVYRIRRKNLLSDCCLVARLKFPEMKDIIGFATEPGLNLPGGRSEDICYVDGRVWTPEMEKEALAAQEHSKILKAPVPTRFHALEFPDVPLERKIKNPRNKKCPCGSGRKYKHCCLNR
ncbi:MAG TPA: SEC-C domain-containing protein [Candidatus Angelobacter sp.]|nr:SEC-C domain-containing protein [Candidatus Angelobacter sp.]